jgi:hypothetical protein
MTKTMISNSDIHGALAERREIAVIWCVEDVLEVRPDLSEESAWAVLQACKRGHDANLGISWDVIRCVADELFGESEGGHNA